MFLFQIHLEETEIEELSRHTIMGYRTEIENAMLNWSLENKHSINKERFRDITGGNPELLDLSDKTLENQPELKKELEERLKLYIQSRFMNIYDTMKRYGVLDYTANLRTTNDKKKAFIWVYSKGNKGLEKLRKYKKEEVYTFEELEVLEKSQVLESIPQIPQETEMVELRKGIINSPYSTSNTPIHIGSFPNIYRNPDILEKFNEIKNSIPYFIMNSVSTDINTNIKLNVSDTVFDLGGEDLLLNSETGKKITISKQTDHLQIKYENNIYDIFPNDVPTSIPGTGINIIVYEDLTFQLVDTFIDTNITNSIEYGEESNWEFSCPLIRSIHGEEEGLNQISVSSSNIQLPTGGTATISFTVDINESENVAEILQLILQRKNDYGLYSNKLKQIFNSSDVSINNLNININTPLNKNTFSLSLSSANRTITETEDIREINIYGNLSLEYMGISISDLNINILDSSSTGTKDGDILAKGTHIFSNNGALDLNFSDTNIDWISFFTNKKVLLSVITDEGFVGTLYFNKLADTVDIGEDQAVFKELHKLFSNGITINGKEIKMIFDIIEKKENIRKIEEITAIKENGINIQEIINSAIRNYAKTSAYAIREFVPRTPLSKTGILRGGIGSMEYSNIGIGMTGGIFNLNLNLGQVFNAHIGTSIHNLNIDYNPITAVDLSVSTKTLSVTPYFFIESSPRIGRFALNTFLYGSYSMLDFPYNFKNNTVVSGSQNNSLIDYELNTGSEEIENKLNMDINIAGKKVLENIETISVYAPIAYGEFGLSYNLKDNLDFEMIGAGIEVTPTYDYKTENYGILMSPYLSANLPYNSKIRLTRFGRNNYSLSLETRPYNRMISNLNLTSSTNTLVGNANLYIQTGDKFFLPKFRIGLEVGTKNKIGFGAGQFGISSGPIRADIEINKQGKWNASISFDVFNTINYITKPNE